MRQGLYQNQMFNGMQAPGYQESLMQANNQEAANQLA